MLIMKTVITMVTERGQISIPADIRRALGVKAGERLLWEPAGEHECRVRRVVDEPVKSAMAMRGFAKRFRQTRRTDDWMKELREGEAR
jgi:AbrB family looped-hinge helix DNA binding protein